MHTRAAISATAFLVYLMDLLDESFVLPGSLRFTPFNPVIKSASRYAQPITEEFNAYLSVSRDESISL